MPQTAFYRAVIAFALIALKSLIPSALLQAQEIPPAQRSLIRIGVWGQGAWQQHSSQFLGLANATYPQAPYRAELVPMRLSTAPFGWNAGILGEVPFWEGNGTSLGIAARLGAQSIGATFTSSLPNVPIGGLSAPGTLDFTLQTNALLLNAEPLLQWRFEQNRFALTAGMSFASAFSENTLQSRTVRASGNISDAVRQITEGSESGTLLGGAAFGSTIVSSAVAGVSWEIPITANGALLLAPEVLYSYALSNLTGNQAVTLLAQDGQSAFWRVSSLRAGLALKFAPEKPIIPPPTPDIPPAPAPVQTPTISTTKAANAAAEFIEPLLAKITSVENVEQSGKRTAVDTLKAEEFLASSSRFLLPYIFFAEQSAALPERYKPLTMQERSTFTPEKLVGATFGKDYELNAYYHLLNIVGYRMKKYPDARLTLTGYTDITAESANKTLGLRRAEAVKDYLQRTWDIAGNRLTAKSGGARGSAETIDAEENRVVEIQSSVPEIFDELRYEYVLRTMRPPNIEITPSITAPRGLRRWDMTIRQDSSIYQTLEGQTLPEPFRWNFTSEANQTLTSLAKGVPTDLLLKEGTLDIILKATDPIQTSTATKQLVVEVLTIDKKRLLNFPDVKIGSYWVFCFDLSSNQIALDNRVRRIVQNIKKQIVPGALLSIAGYTDTRGNPILNSKLASDRAEAVARLLGAESAEVAGKGVSVMYDNALPEGRFYNRFVRVDMRLPIERKQ